MQHASRWPANTLRFYWWCRRTSDSVQVMGQDLFFTHTRYSRKKAKTAPTDDQSSIVWQQLCRYSRMRFLDNNNNNNETSSLLASATASAHHSSSSLEAGTTAPGLTANHHNHTNNNDNDNTIIRIGSKRLQGLSAKLGETIAQAKGTMCARLASKLAGNVQRPTSLGLKVYINNMFPRLL